jgi:hypothetical protein
MSGVARF